MLTRCSVVGWLLVAVSAFSIGCGGPSQSALDEADRAAEGLPSSSRLSEIKVPEEAVAEADQRHVDSYSVQLEAAESKRPKMASKPQSPNQPIPTLSIPPASSENRELTIGDPAPPLAIGSWLKGTPTEGFAAGKVYVIEFWATWCGPCKMNMPHLSDLQQQFGDQVHFIGISDEADRTVTNFFDTEAAPGKLWDDVLKYTIATDADKSTKQRYMQAAGERGIPCAFIVGGDGMIQWIGHPARIDQPLAEVVQGNWDVDQARTARDKARRYEQAFAALRPRLGNWLQSKDFKSAVGAVDALVREFPDRDEPLIMKLDVLRTAGRFAETYPLIETLVERKWDDPNMLSQLAWLIAAETSGPDRDLDLALKAAQRSAMLTSHQAPVALDTLARVYFEQGELDKAIDWQAKAVALGGKFENEMQQTLEKYRKAAE